MCAPTLMNLNLMSFKPRHDPRKSTRLQGYDYSQNGAYFVTLCTQGRLCFFGDIRSDEMYPNDAGNMVLNWYNELPVKFPNIELDAYVLMPNHLHAIIILFDLTDTKGAHVGAPLQNHRLEQTIQWLKTMTTNVYIRGVKEQGWPTFPGKLWQRSFHDHIIRNEDDLNNHRQYILSNPAQWSLDQDNPELKPE